MLLIARAAVNGQDSTFACCSGGITWMLAAAASKVDAGTLLT
jgi:hypothetical protein